MPLIPIDSLDDPRVQVFRQLKARPVLRNGEFFIVEGTKTAARLFESEFETVAVLLIQKRASEWADRVPPNVPCYIVPDELGSELVGFNFHVGVVACGRRRPHQSIDEVLPRDVGALTVVVCPRCDNPENLGAIIRICSGFGVDALLLGPSCCDPFSRRVMRVSMATALKLPIVESRDLASDLQQLRSEWNFELAATVLDPAAKPLHAAQRPARLALLFGNEDTGLETEWRQRCQRELTIPMHPGTDSLNVAIASAIFLHHFTRVVTAS